MAAPFEPIGLTVSFNSGFLARITDISLNLSVDDIDVSHFGSSDYKEYIPTALREPGELSCTIHLDPSLEPPVGDTPEQITITFPDSEGSSWVFDGYMKTFNITGAVGDVMTADCTLKATGAITFN